MKALDHQQLKLNIEHIFESGANEIRVFEMAKQFAERYAMEERERILGIIEEMLDTMEYFNDPREGWCDAKELIEKIKG